MIKKNFCETGVALWSWNFRRAACFVNIILWNFQGWHFVFSGIFKGKVTKLLKFQGFFSPKRMSLIPSVCIFFEIFYWLANNFRFSKIMSRRNPEIITYLFLVTRRISMPNSNPGKIFVDEFNILITKVLKQPC